MMSKLRAQGSSQNRSFKPKIYQGKRKGQARNCPGPCPGRHADDSWSLLVANCDALTHIPEFLLTYLCCHNIWAIVIT